MTDGQELKPETAYSTSSMITGSASQAIGLVTAQDSFNCVSHFEDLTLYSCPSSPSSTACSLRVVSKPGEFDMSATDRDDRWTLSPSMKQHLRVVSNTNAYGGDTSVCDVTLDSGPLKYAHVGIEGPAVDTCYVDAQEVPLTVQSTANVQFGDVTFKETFIVSDVTCPLLSLGSVLRAGWSAEAAQFLRLLAQTKAQSTPQHLRQATVTALHFPVVGHSDPCWHASFRIVAALHPNRWRHQW